MHGVVILCATIPLYITLAYITTQLALAQPYYHDLVPLYSEYAVYAIPVVLISSIVAATVTKPNYDLLCKRLALMLFL